MVLRDGYQERVRRIYRFISENFYLNTGLILRSREKSITQPFFLGS